MYPSFQGYISYVSLLLPLIHPCKVIHHATNTKYLSVAFHLSTDKTVCMQPVPKIKSLKCPDIMSEPTQNYSDIVKFGLTPRVDQLSLTLIES